MYEGCTKWSYATFTTAWLYNRMLKIESDFSLTCYFMNFTLRESRWEINDEINPCKNEFLFVMIILRKATTADTAILEHWDTQPHVIDSDPNDDWDWQSELNREPVWREQLMAEWNGRPVGFVQIINPALEETKYWGEMDESYRAIDIWIGMAEDLGKGYGTIMMELALKICFEDPSVQTVLIDPLASNEKAIRFYERLSFRFIEERMFGEDRCNVYHLTRLDWQLRDARK